MPRRRRRQQPPETSAERSIRERLADINRRTVLREGMVYRDPKVLSGVAVIRGTRVPVFVIVDRYLEEGAFGVRMGWPELTDDEVRAAVRYALHVDPDGARPTGNRGWMRVRRM